MADPTLERLEAAVREMAEIVDAAFGEGTFRALGYSWSAVFLRRPIAPPADGDWRAADHEHRKVLAADLDLLAGRLEPHWRLHNREVQLNLKEIAEANGRTYLEEKISFARLGLCEAAEELKNPQPVKLGPWISKERRDEWSVDEEGNLLVRRTSPRILRDYPTKRVVQSPGRWIRQLIRDRHGDDRCGDRMRVSPDSLNSSVKLRWFVAAAKRTGTAKIRERWAEIRRLPIDDSIMVPWPRDPETGALRDFKDEERIPPPDAALIAEEATALALPDLFKMATPQQRNIPFAVTPPNQGHIVEGAMDRPLTADERVLLNTQCGTKADAARLLGLRDENQVYVQLNRLWKRFSGQRLL